MVLSNIDRLAGRIDNMVGNGNRKLDTRDVDELIESRKRSKRTGQRRGPTIPKILNRGFDKRGGPVFEIELVNDFGMTKGFKFVQAKDIQAIRKNPNRFVGQGRGIGRVFKTDFKDFNKAIQTQRKQEGKPLFSKRDFF